MLAVGVGAALAPAVPAAAAEPRREVWVQGDSVLLGAIDTVRGRLADWDAEVAAFVGLGIETATDVFRDRQADLGSVVVVEIGLNDWRYSSASYSHLLDEAMAVMGDRHVIWLTTPRFRPEMDTVNGALRAAAGRHPNLQVLEWGALIDARPDLAYEDRVHLRPDGQRFFAGVIRDAIDRWWRGSRCHVSDAEMVGAVRRLYRAYFLRDPDQAGLDYWLGRYGSGELCLDGISEQFAVSPEFTARYGTLGVPEFVRLVYLNVLGREPDPDGYNYWAGRLAYEGLRRGEMMAAFSQSAEFRARSGIS